MKIITKYKTTELIKLAHGDCKLIVCHSSKETHRIKKEAEKLNLKIHLPISYDEFLAGRYSKSNVNSILLDNADAFIQYVSNVEVEAITIDKGTYKLEKENNKLKGVLQNLVNTYIANIDTESEFIKCITPKTASRMTFFERKKSKAWQAWDNARIVLAETKDVSWE